MLDEEEAAMGGKPSTGTPKDKRLKGNASPAPAPAPKPRPKPAK